MKRVVISQFSLLLILSLNCFAAPVSQVGGIEYPNNLSYCPIESKPAGNGGDFTPFPWGNEIPIAQSTLQGIWAPTSIECGTYFKFELSNNSSNQQRLVTVRQFDPESCQVIATGVGYEFERVFYVSMVGSKGRSFDLTVRAFDRKDLKSTNSATDDYTIEFPNNRARPYIVATLYPRHEWTKKVSYPLLKVSGAVSYSCANGDELPRKR